MAGKRALVRARSLARGGEKGCASRRPAEGEERALFFSFPPPFFHPRSSSPSPPRRSVPCRFASLPSSSSLVDAPSLALSCSFALAEISLGRAISLSHRGPPYSLRPFNSIATPFYNAAARAAGREVAEAPDAPTDPR